MQAHTFRELVNDLRDIAKQYHSHDSLRDRISGRLREDIHPDDPATVDARVKRKPTGFVAICQCGLIVGAIDITRTPNKEAGQILGKWLHDGCTVDPRFEGTWDAHVMPCRCRKQPPKNGG